VVCLDKQGFLSLSHARVLRIIQIYTEMGSGIVSVLIVVLAVGIGSIGYFVLKDGEIPEIPDQYWGSGTPKGGKEDTSIRPFQINISEKVLSDLKTRLSLEVATLDDRVENTLEGVGFEYGFNKKFLTKVAKHWLNTYQWKEREKLLNKFPNFKTKISGIDIHFQHVKPTKKDGRRTRPLLLLHGWPSSFIEYQSIIPLLIDAKDSDLSFQLVIPSLPGFGFSEGAKKPGLGSAEMSLIFLKLMKRLGYEKFYVQGGDWGSIIAGNMGTLYKDNVLGIHMTMCHTLHPRTLLKFGVASIFPHLFMDEDERNQHFPPFNFIYHMIRESGYLHMQGTKPDTIGIGLSNSPTGLAAYLIEKFSFWTNHTWVNKEDGGISSAYKLEPLLDNVMVHWFSRVTSSLRIYRETLNLFTSNQPAVDRVSAQVPASCFNMPMEPLTFPKWPLLEKFPRLRYTKSKTGGHINMMEIPIEVGKDLIQAVNFMELENGRKSSTD